MSRSKGEDRRYHSARMMRLLLEHEAGDPAKYASLAGELAKETKAAGAWHHAREFWTIKALWHRRAGEVVEERLAAIAAAETYVQQSQDRLINQTAAPYMHAAGDLNFAIEALRRIHGTQERVNELHHRLLDYEKRSTSEFHSVDSGPIDLNEPATQAKQKVKGKSFHDAILTLAFMMNPTDFAATRKMAEERFKSPIFKLFPSTRTNALGKVIGRQSSLGASSPEEAEGAILDEMFDVASHSWNLHAVGVIDPARQQIKEDHEVRINDFRTLVINNPLVPQGREILFARGLHAGLLGDFVTSTHLLIPQLEHALRCVLEANGEVTSGIDPEGIQREFDLNTLLKTSRMSGPLVKIFGEDFVFDLRGLLVEAFGANLRNEVAHGLLSVNQMYSYASRYVWWLTLRMCCLPILARMHGSDARVDTADEGI